MLDFLSRDFKNAFENYLAAGNVFADDLTAIRIQGATETRLDLHIAGGILTRWENVSVAPLPNDPRTFEVSARIFA